MDIKAILHDDKKKKLTIIGLFLFFIILGLLFIFTRDPSSTQTDDNQLWSDIAMLAPRDSVSQSTNRAIAPIIGISSDAAAVPPGESAVISWVSNNAERCTDGDGNEISTTGSLPITPTENYTLDVVCSNTIGTTIESITVVVTSAPFIGLSAYPASVRVGEDSLISWNTINATRCTDSAGNTLRLNDGFIVSPKKAYSFEINCTGPNGADKKKVTVTIDTSKPPAPTATIALNTIPTQKQPQPIITPTQKSPATDNEDTAQTTIDTYTSPGTLTISASKTKVAYGEPSVISWSTTNATNCRGTTNTGVELLNSSTGQTGIILMPLFSPFLEPVPLPDNGSIAIRVLDGRRIATLIIRCDNSDGTQTERSITVTSDTAPISACANKRPCLNIDPNMTSLTIAQGTTLDVRWSSSCATSCKLRSTGGGSAITYPTPEYLASLPELNSSADYNKYISIPTSLIGIEKSGGVRVGAGTLTFSCTNNNAIAPLTITKSMTIAYPPPPKKKKFGGFGGLIAVAVFAVATFYSAGILSVVSTYGIGAATTAVTTGVVTAGNIAVGAAAGLAAGALTGGSAPNEPALGAANPASWGSSMGCNNVVSSAGTPNSGMVIGAGDGLLPSTVTSWAIVLVTVIIALIIAYMIYRSNERRKNETATKEYLP